VTLKEQAAVQAALQVTINQSGSARLRAGSAFLLAGLKGWRYAGTSGGDHVFRKAHETVLVDVVTRRVIKLMRIMPETS